MNNDRKSWQMINKDKIVIASGDGGLDSKSPLMDLYILAQAKKENPKVCLLPTAGGDDQGLIKYFYSLYNRYPCKPSHFSVFNPHTADARSFLLSQDVVFVSGGHSRCMLALWKEYGIDTILREAYNRGIVLSGGSAGSVCWFDQCITDSIPGRLSVMNCLGILPYSNCPHFASTSRRSAYARFVSSGEIGSGYAADDYSALHFVNGSFLRGVSIRPYAQVFKVGLENNTLVQKRLRTKWLGLKSYQEELVFNTAMFNRSEKESE